jgi:hypothetical protein
MAIASGLGIYTCSLHAHHSVDASHDVTRLITIKGTVTMVVWRNPHASIVLSVKAVNGDVHSEQIEIGAPARLTKTGFSPNDLKVGDAISIEAWPAKIDSRFRGVSPAGRTVILPDFRRIDVSDNWGRP